MADAGIPTSQDPPLPPRAERPAAVPRRLITAADERISFGPNLVATLASFGLLVIAPLVFGPFVLALTDDGVDHVSALLLLFVPLSAVVLAVVGSLLFLMIGLILQLWQRHQHFASGWPVVLAFPIAWALLLPETFAPAAPRGSGSSSGPRSP